MACSSFCPARQAYASGWCRPGALPFALWLRRHAKGRELGGSSSANRFGAALEALASRFRRLASILDRSAYPARLRHDVVVNAGGGIHGHPKGTAAGGQAFRQAIDATLANISLPEAAAQPGNEALQAAIDSWGYKE